MVGGQAVIEAGHKRRAGSAACADGTALAAAPPVKAGTELRRKSARKAPEPITKLA